MRIYVVTGATGNIGKPITLGLLAQGHAVRIISRSAEKAKELIDKGALLFQGDTRDAAVLKSAFSGADAVYVMIPFDVTAQDYTAMQVSHANAIADALKATGVKYAVTLSSLGAHLTSGAGVVQGLEKMERALNAIPGLHVLHLRPSYFMENTLAQAGIIKHMGIMASAVRGDLKLPMVATKDIAAVALQRLLKLNFSGKSHQYILGQRDVTYNEIAEIYGKMIGKPDLKYVITSAEDTKAAMMGMGLGESVVDKLNEFVKALNEGRVLKEAKRAPENTTPTRIEEFSSAFKTVYERS